MGDLGEKRNLLLAGFDLLLSELVESVKGHYGPRLVSIAAFGSVARRTPGPLSDLDVLVVADELPSGRLRRVEQFEPVEAALAGRLESLKEAGLHTRLSPVLRTPNEIEQYGGPIFLDMTEHVLILHDRGRFLSNYLGRLRSRLAAQGARRLTYRGACYWDLGSGGGDHDR
ncbi:MAG: nucleotidyltransferase domain-containing protein [bacterium]|nr:nucleotidyltransferase domain-containing protein [bacterium]